MNVTGTFHNDAMLPHIKEAVMIITPHSLYHLLVNLLSAKCLFVFFLYSSGDKRSAQLVLASPCKGPCNNYSLKHLLF